MIRPLMVRPLIVAVALLAGVATTARAQVTPTHGNVTFAQLGPRALRMDIYLPPTGGGPRPLVVWLHDGGWLSGNRTLPAFVPPLLERGIAIASIDFRLTSQAGLYGVEGVTFPAQIHDVKAAIRFLRAHAAEYGIDPARIGAWGSSSGGHLAALAGTAGNVPALEGDAVQHREHSSRVQAVVDYYGPTDLLNLNPDVATPPGSALDHDTPGAPGSLLIGFSGAGQGLGQLRANLANAQTPFPTYRALALAASPVSHVDALDPPFLIVHGSADPQVAIRQSQRLVDALAAVGANPEFLPVAGAGHGGFPPAVHAQAIDFLAARLGADTIPIGNPLALTGAWYEPSTSGQGIEVQWMQGDLMVVYFYGFRDDGSNLTLLGTRVGRPSYGQVLEFELTVASNGRYTGFDAGAVERRLWGTLALRFDDCGHASAVLAGEDGDKTLALVPIVLAASPTRCD